MNSLTVTLPLFATLLGGAALEPETSPGDQVVEQSSPAQSSSAPAWPGNSYAARTVEIAGHPMRYVDEGSGDPILMVHGLPSHGYLWRNVVGPVADHGRVIVPDVMGFGGSYQGPDLDYGPVSQQAYFDEFMSKMELDDITLVVNDLGSVLALNWASRHPDKIKGIVLVEAVMFDARSWWKNLPLSMKLSLRLLQNPKRARKLIVDRNFVIERALLQSGVRRELTEDEKTAYRVPFEDIEVRERVLLQAGPANAPIGGRADSPTGSGAFINAYADWLRDTEIPKLLLHAKPGLINGRRAVRQAKRTFTNLETVLLGRGSHFLPEDHPDAIASEIVKFVGRI